MLTDELMALLRQGQDHADAFNRPILVSVAQPAPHGCTPLAAFAAGRRFGSHRAFWARPSEGLWLVGLGSATSLTAHDPRPVEDIRQAYRSSLHKAIISDPGVRGVGPVFMGGFRFDPEAPRSSLWKDFPNGHLVLPKLLFTFSDTHQWLTVNACMQPGADWRAVGDILATELESLLTSISEGMNPSDAPSKPQVETQTSTEEWSRWVQQILRAIEAGNLTKVVLARKLGLSSQSEFSRESVLDRLCLSYPECTVFALEADGSSFLGASPEVLVQLKRGVLSLSCLAGSVARGATPEEDQLLTQALLSSAKDQHEHATVVTTVAQALDGVCQELRWDTVPSVLKLRTVQHLATSFSGRLNGQTNILDLVEVLHPTPAVGGVPNQQALGLIRSLEGDRGWYAGPVGWLDHHGEGQFSVAIRSALIQGNQATLFAGSGIVAGSDPDLEKQETELKFQPLLSALGGV